MSEAAAFRQVESQFVKEISEVGDRTDLLYQQMQKNTGKTQFERRKKKTQVSRFNVDFIRSQRFKQFYEKQMGWVKVEKPIEGNEFSFDNLVSILSKKKGVNEDGSKITKSNKNESKKDESKKDESKIDVKLSESKEENSKTSKKEKEVKVESEKKETKKEAKKEKGVETSAKEKTSGKESKKKEKKAKSKTK